MKEVAKKSLTVALAAVLLFMLAFPVPTGVKAFDAIRAQKAEAVAPALAVPVILATALAAGGVYVTGAAVTEYNANLNDVYNGLSSGTSYWSQSWAQYVADKGSFDNAMQSCVTEDGNISLQTLTDAGFWDGVRNYTAYCVQEGTMESGSSSLGTSNSVVYIDGAGFNAAVPNFPSWVTGNANYQSAVAQGYEVIWWSYSAYSDAETYRFAMAQPGTTFTYTSGTNPRLRCTGYDCVFQRLLPSQRMNQERVRADTVGVYQSGNSGYDYYLNPSYTFTLPNNQVSNGVVAATAAVIDGALLSSAAPTATVEPFEPTAEQLAEGYTNADIIDAINSNTGTAEGILGFLQQNFPILGTIASTLAGVAADVTTLVADWASIASQPFSWLQTWWGTLTGWWQSLLAWLGATPFGTVMGTVIDGVQAIPDGIRNLGNTLGGVLDDVKAGVLALPGVLEGLLDGVRAGVLSIPGVLQGVLEGVIAIPAEMVRVIAGFFVAEEAVETASEGLNLNEELRAQLDLMLDMKAPFCYMKRMQELATGIAGNFGGSPTFYVDVDIPFAGVQRFDAGEILNQGWGTFTVAQYIRVLLTASMCAGLLAVSLKIAIGRIGAKKE